MLDHHKTAREVLLDDDQAEPLPLNVDVRIDESKSGATMAWDHFKPTEDNLGEWNDELVSSV